jgi:tetratricopeptide (TPR) repeat protein
LGVLRYVFFLVAVLAPVAAICEERDPLIGKLVVLKPDSVLTRDGKVVDPRFQPMPPRVSGVDQDRLWIGRSWVRKSDVLNPDEALRLCDEKLKDEPKNAQLWRLRGLAWMAKDEDRNAIYSLDEALRLDPKLADAFVDRGVARIKMGAGDSASRDFTNAIRIDQTNPVPYAHRGTNKLRNKEFEEALLDCDRAIELDPECDFAFKLRGDVAYFQGDYRSAISDYGKAIRYNPRHFEAYASRAICHMRQREVDEALRDIEEAVRLSPQQPYPLFLRGCCRFLKGNDNAAIEDLSECIRIKPDHMSAYLIRSGLYQCVEKDREGLDDVKACLRVAPSDPILETEVAFFLATSNDAELRDGKGAIDSANKACQMTGWKAAWPIAALAAGHAEVGDWKNAIRFQKEAIEKSPEESRARQQEILSLYEKHQPLRATIARTRKNVEATIGSLSPQLKDDAPLR